MTGKMALHQYLHAIGIKRAKAMCRQIQYDKEKYYARHSSKEDTTDSEGHGKRTSGTKLRKGHTHWGQTPRVLRSSDE